MFSQNVVDFGDKLTSDCPVEMISNEQVTLGSGGFFSLLASF